MAIIKKDGFEFIDDINGNPEAFVLKGIFIEREIEYIIKNKIKSLYLNFFDSKGINNLDFLERISFIEKININDLDIDYSGLYHLKNLEYAIICVKNKKQYLDYSEFKHLKYLSIDWYSQFPNLAKNEKLKELVIWKFKPKSKSFIELNLPKELENLEVTESNILSIEGLNLHNLKKIEAHYCNSLNSLRGIKNISLNLNAIILDNCKKLTNYNDLGDCKKLEKIILSNCGEIPSLKWLKELKRVKHFSFWNTRLYDGNTNPCFGIDYVSFKNAKHYNHKEEEFDN